MNLLIQSSYSKFIKRGPSEKRWMVIRAIIFRRKGKRNCWTPRNYLILFLNKMHLFTNQFQFYALSLSYQYLPFKGLNNPSCHKKFQHQQDRTSRCFHCKGLNNSSCHKKLQHQQNRTSECFQRKYFRIFISSSIWNFSTARHSFGNYWW